MPRNPLMILVWAVLLLTLTGCPPGNTDPAAKTPILSGVFKPGQGWTNVGIDPAGTFEVLPSVSVILFFRAPFPSSFQISVNGTLLEETSDLTRQQALEAQNLGYWYLYSGSMANPDFSSPGDPNWWVIVAPAPSLRITSGFNISVVDVSNNPTFTGTNAVSLPMPVAISLGIPDWIALANNASHDNAYVLLDSRRDSGCSQYEVFRGTSIVNVGSVLAPSGCTSEVVVFSQGQAMILDSPQNTWTNNLRDLVTEDLSHPSWQVPVNTWLLNNSQPDVLDISSANSIYDSSRAGISFTEIPHNVAGNTSLITMLGDLSHFCDNSPLMALESSQFFVAGQINVYYVTFSPSTFDGLTCAQTPRNVIAIGTNEVSTTLAHELGHSLSLSHTNGVQGFTTSNLMWGGGMQDGGLTGGQGFRANVNKTSSINMNQVRHGWLRDCPDGTTSDTCPALTFDAH
jgi:hypothetical protein